MCDGSWCEVTVPSGVSCFSEDVPIRVSLKGLGVVGRKGADETTRPLFEALEVRCRLWKRARFCEHRTEIDQSLVLASRAECLLTELPVAAADCAEEFGVGSASLHCPVGDGAVRAESAIVVFFTSASSAGETGRLTSADRKSVV